MNKYKKALICSLMVTGIGMAINLITAYCFNKSPFLALSTVGGDCISYRGFGLDILELFAINEDEKLLSMVYHTDFDFLSLIVTIALSFGIILLIDMFLRRKK